MLPFELTKDTPYLALSGELWSVFYEYFTEIDRVIKGFYCIWQILTLKNKVMANVISATLNAEIPSAVQISMWHQIVKTAEVSAPTNGGECTPWNAGECPHPLKMCYMAPNTCSKYTGGECPHPPTNGSAP